MIYFVCTTVRDTTPAINHNLLKKNMHTHTVYTLAYQLKAVLKRDTHSRSDEEWN